LNLKDRAHHTKNLIHDPIFKESFERIREDQIKVFTNEGSPIENIKRAHDIIGALNKIENYFQSIISEEIIFDKRNGD
jgi:hypothetical protein